MTLLAFSLQVHSTAQYGDILIYKGDTLQLFSNPLENYLETKSRRTINDYELTWTSTACYRGYIATWKIANDSLYLLRVQKGCQSENPQYFDLKLEFGTDSVFAYWYTGKALAPKGKLIHYVHDAYESFYEYEIVLAFENGLLTSKQEFDNSKSYKSVYTENQDSLIKFIYRNINWSKIPDLKNESKRVYISILSGKSIKPDSIELVRAADIEVLNSEALRVINMLPEWDVYYKKGEVCNIKWTIPIIF